MFLSLFVHQHHIHSCGSLKYPVDCLEALNPNLICASKIFDKITHFRYSKAMVSRDLKNTIDSLSEEDRVSLASYILHGFEAPTYDVSDETVMDRVNELQSGKVKEIDHDTLVNGLDLQGGQ